MQPHPRISVNSICSLYQPLPADIGLWADLGVDHVGLTSTKLEAEGWEPALAMVSQAGLHVSNVATETVAVATDSLHFAASVGAPTVYLCTGSRSCAQLGPSSRIFLRLG